MDLWQWLYIGNISSICKSFLPRHKIAQNSSFNTATFRMRRVAGT